MDLSQALAKYSIEEYDKIRPFVVDERDLDLLWNKVVEESKNFINHLYKMENKEYFLNSSEEESSLFYKKHQILKKIIYDKLLEKYYLLSKSAGFDDQYVSTAKDVASKINSVKKHGLTFQADYVDFLFYLRHFDLKTEFQTPIVSVPTIISSLGIDKTKNEDLFNLFVIIRMSEDEIPVLRELYTFSKYLKI